MKRTRFLIPAFLLFSAILSAKPDCSVENLRCEYAIHPLGVDVLTPHLSWVMTSEQRGDFQSAYQVLVASSPELLRKGKGDLWDSGKIKSDNSVHIAYQGKDLQSATTYYWKVRIWNKEQKPSDWSEPARWTMGLLSPDAWEGAQWIAYKDGDTWRKEWEKHKERELKDHVFEPESWPWLTGKDSSIFALYEMAQPKYDPAPLFRKTFPVRKKIQKATLFICGLGYYEAFINGKKVGDHVLDPAWTNYEQRAMYVTYDVTDMLQQGKNAIGVMLGRGQYNPLCNDIWGLYKSAWIDQPKLIAFLRIEHQDKTTINLVTDPSWKTHGGPIIYDDTRHGELYDARLEQDGWTTPIFDDNQWKNASEIAWNATLVSQMIPPIRCFEPVHPVKTFARKNNVTIYDLGENIVGWATINVKGPTGARVLVEYCETPSDKELVPNLPPSRFEYNLKDPHYAAFYDKGVNIRQQNGYILRGMSKKMRKNKGESARTETEMNVNGDLESFRCHFSYKAFRFIRITADEGVTIESVAGVPVHTDVEKTGDFSCSNPVINQIQQNAVKSLKSNYHSIATDCPHREKQGWTADNYMTAQAAMYNFNLASFYSKWLIDLAGTRNEQGGLCTVAPSTGYDMAISTAWPAAIVYMPLDIYRFYGDKRPMATHYETMKNFTKNSLLRQKPDKPEIINEVLGDWLAPLMEIVDGRRNNTMAPPEGLSFYGTAAHYLTVKRTGEIGAILGKQQDAKTYADWAATIRQNFNKEYYDPATGTYHGENPTEYRQSLHIVPLEYGLAPQDDQASILKQLIADIHTKGNRLSTGFLGTMTMMEYLPKYDPELAYTLASHPNYPGWGYMIAQGADIMWEDWDGYASRNHTPFCLISGYFYKYLAGICYDTENPGFKQIIIHPTIIDALNYVDAYHDSMYGRIRSSWKRENDTLTMQITIPANTMATIYLPTTQQTRITESGTPITQQPNIRFLKTENDNSVYTIGSGSYSFEITL